MTTLDLTTLPAGTVILDTEYTAWEGSWRRRWSGPGEYREIIQLGAIRLDGAMQEVASFNELVRPVHNPQLSDYIIRLTGITQHRLDSHGHDLAEGLARLTEFAGDAPILSNGTDGELVFENCDLAGVRCPIQRERFIDVRPTFCALTEVPYAKLVSGDLYLMADPELDPTQISHDAVWDTRSIAMLLRHLRDGHTIRACAVGLLGV